MCVSLQMLLLEKSEAQKRHYERKCDEMAARLRETERTLASLQQDMAKYQVGALRCHPVPHSLRYSYTVSFTDCMLGF